MLRYKLVQPKYIIVHFILPFKWGKNPRLFRFYPISCSFLSSKTSGGPEGIRTLGRPVKSRTLYLAKLQALLCTADTLERLAKQGDYIIISDFQGPTRAP